MYGTDAAQDIAALTGGQELIHAMAEVFGQGMSGLEGSAAMPRRQPPPPGRGRPGTWWLPGRLIAMLMLTAWESPGLGLVDRFERVRLALRAPDDEGRTYQGFIKALSRHETLPDEVMRRLRTTTTAWAGDFARRLGFEVFACDGSRFELPRTEANEAFFGVGGKGEGPQAWVTMLWHMGVGLPWAWKIDRADAGERAHLLEMLDALPPQALLVADAGYSGFDLLERVIASGRDFLIRVGANVKLIQKLGFYRMENRQTVYLWPDRAQRQGRAPLTLRLIEVRDDKGRSMHLLTSVRDAGRLSDADAAVLYRMRWGIEQCYRHVKQTMHKRKLRSAAPRQAHLELHGLLAALTCLGLVSVRRRIERGEDPLRWSVARALGLVWKLLHHGAAAAGDVWNTLARAVKDACQRTRKTRRDWPRKDGGHAPPAAPHLRPAHPHETQRARQLSPRP